MAQIRDELSEWPSASGLECVRVDDIEGRLALTFTSSSRFSKPSSPANRLGAGL
jgi:hypothetical protein